MQLVFSLWKAQGLILQLSTLVVSYDDDDDGDIASFAKASEIFLLRFTFFWNWIDKNLLDWFQR